MLQLWVPPAICCTEPILLTPEPRHRPPLANRGPPAPPTPRVGEDLAAGPSPSPYLLPDELLAQELPGLEHVGDVVEGPQLPVLVLQEGQKWAQRSRGAPQIPLWSCSITVRSPSQIDPQHPWVLREGADSRWGAHTDQVGHAKHRATKSPSALIQAPRAPQNPAHPKRRTQPQPLPLLATSRPGEGNTKRGELGN